MCKVKANKKGKKNATHWQQWKGLVGAREEIRDEYKRGYRIQFNKKKKKEKFFSIFSF